ncbi:MAG: threonylcarbamoyl-AMP synthase [Actinomycetospora chiangmaiensis]|nr:threonylcarbamoyl-AMP synthase [Actinomycetospora chiangmaiensis]
MPEPEPATRILPAPQAMSEAARLIEAEDVVAIPTETVYGLAGDAGSGTAVAKIFAAKGRPSFNPLIVHVSGLSMAERIGRLDPLSRRLAERFWPGPLTLVVPLGSESGIHPLALAGLPTVALRQPQGFAGLLLERLGRPLAAPSANASGRISPTTAEAVAATLHGRIPLIVDGGQAGVGVESSIVKAEHGRLRLLRPGGLAAEELEEAAGAPLLRPTQDGTAAVEAPGMLLSHYAPDAGLRLDATDIQAWEALLAFGPRRAANAAAARVVLNLSERGDLAEAAANLFLFLRRLDAARPARIAVEPIPRHGLGEAINDRLRRAAAPRHNSSKREVEK